MTYFTRSVATILFVGFVVSLTPLDSLAKGKKKEPEPKEKKQLPADKHFPEIPSMKLLSQQEYFAMAQLIQLVILDDIGKGPKGPRAVSGKETRQAFNKLGPEAIPLMIQALNYCTQQEWTCPTTILGMRLGGLLTPVGDDLDFLEYMHANLGKGVTLKEPHIQFTSAKNAVNGRIISVKKELAHKYKTMELAALKEKADAYQKQPSTKHAAWRFMIATIPERKDKLECVEILFAALEKSSTPTERKTAHASLVTIAGVDHGPKDFESLGSTLSVMSKWREWHKEHK